MCSATTSTTIFLLPLFIRRILSEQRRHCEGYLLLQVLLKNRSGTPNLDTTSQVRQRQSFTTHIIQQASALLDSLMLYKLSGVPMYWGGQEVWSGSTGTHGQSQHMPLSMMEEILQRKQPRRMHWCVNG